jgi:Domain of unknown function (DUF4123)
MPRPRPEQVIQGLWRPMTPHVETQMYAVLDAARDQRVYPGLVNAGGDYCSLYRGEQAEDLCEVAPYLVHLEPETALTQWLINLGWGDHWGIFLGSAAAMPELRRHLRRFLMVYDAQGKPLYFRYYDPRVLRVYLPTCNGAELQIFFGPVLRFCIESEDGATLIEYTQAAGQLRQRQVHLDT